MNFSHLIDDCKASVVRTNDVANGCSVDLSERQHERVQRSLRLIAAREAYATAREHVLALSNQNRP